MNPADHKKQINAAVKKLTKKAPATTPLQIFRQLENSGVKATWKQVVDAHKKTKLLGRGGNTKSAPGKLIR